MKPTKLFLALTVAVLLGACTSTVIAQKQKYGNYREIVDSLMQELTAINEYNNATLPPMFYQIRTLQYQIDSLTTLKDSILHRRDSLVKVIEGRRRDLNNDYVETFRKYIPYSEDALADVFTMRSAFGKDSLEKILTSLKPQNRKSLAAKRIRQYLYEDFPSLIGTEFKPFTCYTLTGKKYDWKLIKGKKMLIILDGYGCMNHFDPTAGGRYLKSICEKAGNEHFALVAFLYTKDLKQMTEFSELYEIEELNPVSDLEGELSELHLRYQVRGTPTVIYVDKNGIITHYEMGINLDRINEFLFPVE